jgi:signal peptidase II
MGQYTTFRRVWGLCGILTCERLKACGLVRLIAHLYTGSWLVLRLALVDQGIGIMFSLSHPLWTRLLSRLLILGIIGINVGCDQVSKSLVREHVHANAYIPVLGSYLTLTHVQNTGAFLSLGNTLPHFLRHLLLTFLPIALLAIAFFYLMFKSRLSRPTLVGASLMIGGGMGNLYDRVLYGSVTDFLHLKFMFLQTGIFNVADMSIMFGLGILILSNTRRRID